MAVSVTRTKVILPQRRKDLFSRDRLVDKLYELTDLKLTLLIAPAGYGKTSLLVDFAHQADLPVCWFSIDTFDADPLRFIAHFIASIQEIFPDFGSQSNAALESTNPLKPDVIQLADASVNDSYEHIFEHYIVILDDYHLVQKIEPIAHFINRFILKIADNCHIVLASRTLITLPDLPLLVARSQVSGLGFEELAFRAEEVQSLILQNYHTALSSDKALDLVNATEGWITGLLMTAQSKIDGMGERLRIERLTGVGLYNYFAHQVFDEQDPTTREFMMQTSFLEEFDAQLCEEIWGNTSNWQALLETVLQNNLFVLPVGEDAHWLRYHHLLRDFLQAQYKQDHPEALTSLLHKIAGAYARRQEWDRSFAVYQSSGDMNACADLVERAGSALVRDSRLSILASWLEALPPEIIYTRPRLLSHKGALLLMEGRVEHGMDYLNLAENYQSSAGDQPGLARTLARRATGNNFLGKYSESLTDGSKALELAGKNDELLPIRAEAFHSIGISFYHLGQLDNAIGQLNQSLNAYQALGDSQNTALVNMELGLCYHNAGHFQQALAHYERALQHWRRIQNTARQSFILNNLGVLHHYSGNYVQAGKLFDEALAYARHNNQLRSEAYILCSIGDLYSDLGMLSSAQDAYQKTREIARKIDDRFLLINIAISEAALARQADQLSQASAFIFSAQAFFEESQSNYEKGLWCLEAGQIRLAEKKADLAVEHLKEASHLFETGGQIIEAARAYLHLAQAQQAVDCSDEVHPALRKAFKLAKALDNLQPLVVAGQSSRDVLAQALRDPELTPPAASLLRLIEEFEKNNPSYRRALRPQTTSVVLAPPRITIHTLGRSLVELDGKPVTSIQWTNQKRARELFFFILAHPKGVTKEEIGEMLWHDSSRPQLKLQFKNALYRLRCALGSDIILYEDYRYHFNAELDYTYDVQMFEESIEQARQSTSPKDQIKYFKNAVKIYQGSYYPEGEGTWVLVEQKRIETRYMEAAISLARLLQEAGEYRASLTYCQRILEGDRCQEEAHRLAMQAHAALGNRGAISRQYEDCRQALQEEMGMKPSPETEALYKILRK